LTNDQSANPNDNGGEEVTVEDVNGEMSKPSSVPAQPLTYFSFGQIHLFPLLGSIDAAATF
jgi:hypothetical protein